jgi:hypothetical protein
VWCEIFRYCHLRHLCGQVVKGSFGAKVGSITENDDLVDDREESRRDDLRPIERQIFTTIRAPDGTKFFDVGRGELRDHPPIVAEGLRAVRGTNAKKSPQGLFELDGVLLRARDRRTGGCQKKTFDRFKCGHPALFGAQRFDPVSDLATASDGVPPRQRPFRDPPIDGVVWPHREVGDLGLRVAGDREEEPKSGRGEGEMHKNKYYRGLL